MTELQKLSLKKLRKMKLPLYVLDRKSKKGGFVIQDLQAYEGQAVIKDSVPLDYRAMGLLWDHPSISNEEFHEALKNPSSENHEWVARRVLERVSSMTVKEILSLDELKAMVSQVKIRPFFQEAWNHAVQYWCDFEDTLSIKVRCLVSQTEIQDFLDLFRIIPSNLTNREIIELAMRRESGLDPLILANQIEFVLKSPPPPKELLGTTNWTDLQLFFRKFQKECLDLIRP